MKKLIFLTVLTCTFFALQAQFSQLNSGLVNSQSQIVSTQTVLLRVAEAIKTIEDLNKQVLFVQVDNISKGVTSSQTYQLSGGEEYVIAAIGDEDRITDIDLEVYDSNGYLVGKDTKTSNVAVVIVQASSTQTYKFKIKGYAMSQNDGFYGIIVSRK